MSTHSMSIVEVRCDAVHVGDRHRRDLGEIESLAESIATEGLLQPIGITEESVLVFGERRLRAVQDVLRRETISARVVHVRSITAGEYAENQIRKDFTPSERVAIGKALEAEAGDRRGQRTDLQIPEHLPALAPTSSSRQLVTDLAQVEPGVKTRVIVAKAAGFDSASTYGQAKKVVAQGAPDLVAAMDSGEVSISAAAVIAAEPRERQNRSYNFPVNSAGKSCASSGRQPISPLPEMPGVRRGKPARAWRSRAALRRPPRPGPHRDRWNPLPKI